jgi:hypothetical protein
MSMSAAVCAPRLQAIMGRASIATTRRYVPLANQALTKAELAAFGYWGVRFVGRRIGMLPVPKVPTQNLYKFAAIAGTILVIAVLCIWARIWRELTDVTHEFRKTSDVLHMQHDFLLAEGQDLGLSFADLQRHHADHYTDPEKKELERKWEQLRDGWLPMLTESTYVDWFQRTFYFISAGCLLFMLFGIGVATWGYHHWYHRVQVHEDVRAAARARLLKSETPTEIGAEGEPTPN